MSKSKKLYLRYWCTKIDCGYKLVIEKGLSKSKSGTFVPPCYGCPNDEEPLMMEISETPFSVFTTLPDLPLTKLKRWMYSIIQKIIGIKLVE